MVCPARGQTKNICESCYSYRFDDQSGYYVCEMDLDEDEAERYFHGGYSGCPFYRSNDDYEIVRHQN